MNPKYTVTSGTDSKRGFVGKYLSKDAIGLHVLAKTYEVDLSVLEYANKSNKGGKPKAYDAAIMKDGWDDINNDACLIASLTKE